MTGTSNALRQERYSMGECVACGDRLDDVSLAAGFSECADCDPDPNAAWSELYDARWTSWPSQPWTAANLEAHTLDVLAAQAEAIAD